MLPQIITDTLINKAGIGIAIADAETRHLVFRNPAFASWFPGAEVDTPLDTAVEALRGETLDAALAGRVVEIGAKPKRRLLTIEIRISTAEHHGREILILECQNISRLRETEALIASYSAMADRRARDLEREKTRVEKLLLNLMPRTVYDEFRNFGTVTPKLYEPVSVIMLDFVGFTEMAVARDPTETVQELNELFTAFDRIAEQYGCERIKTAGDCYMAVAGLPHPTPDHARLAAECSAKMLRYLAHRNEAHVHTWQARIGIASGAVVGSVIGINKYIYDVFGPAVNLAARLQARADPMEICVLEATADTLGDDLDIGRVRTETLRGFGEMSVAAVVDRSCPRIAA